MGLLILNVSVQEVSEKLLFKLTKPYGGSICSGFRLLLQRPASKIQFSGYLLNSYC